MAFLKRRMEHGTGGEYCNSNEDAKRLVSLKIGAEAHEQFAVLYMDNKHRLIAMEIESQGTVNGAAVYPRQVVRNVIKHNAAAIILAHNHPSGETYPSGADDAVTRRIQEAVQHIDCRVLDHIIVGGDFPYSYSERGRI